jgi:hypothetical protein
MRRRTDGRRTTDGRTTDGRTTKWHIKRFFFQKRAKKLLNRHVQKLSKKNRLHNQKVKLASDSNKSKRMFFFHKSRERMEMSRQSIFCCVHCVTMQRKTNIDDFSWSLYWRQVKVISGKSLNYRTNEFHCLMNWNGHSSLCDVCWCSWDDDFTFCNFLTTWISSIQISCYLLCLLSQHFYRMSVRPVKQIIIKHETQQKPKSKIREKKRVALGRAVAAATAQCY